MNVDEGRGGWSAGEWGSDQDGRSGFGRFAALKYLSEAGVLFFFFGEFFWAK